LGQGSSGVWNGGGGCVEKNIHPSNFRT
jgi:hypothetical protein